MLVKKLELSNYRNIEKQSINLHPTVNVFVGDNGQGKTNILEALYLLSRGQSFRAGTSSVLIKEGNQAGLIKAQILRNGLESELRVLLEQNRKSIFVDGKRTTALKLMQHHGSVLFSPESLASIKEGSEQRRKLVDEVVGSYNSKGIQDIQDFLKLLRSRNKTLREIANPDSHRVVPDLIGVLEALNRQYFKAAENLTWLRILALRELQPHFQNALTQISGENVDIAVEYVISDKDVSTQSIEDTFSWMNQRAEQLQSAEKSAGTSLAGPHKHDVRFLFNGKDSRYFCSQGQQRALILAFKMAQIVYHRKVHEVFPVLMLDDVLSELDKEKRERLVDFLAGIDTQIFITTTDFGLPDWLSTNELAVFQVKQGRVSSGG